MGEKKKFPGSENFFGKIIASGRDWCGNTDQETVRPRVALRGVVLRGVALGGGARVGPIFFTPTQRLAAC